MARTQRTGRVVRRAMRGFAMTEVGLGLVIASMVAAASYYSLYEQQGDNKAIAQGTALLSLQGAAQQYLTTNFSQLVQPGGGTVAGVTNPLNPTVAELFAVGALKGAWSGTAYNGGNYRIQIQQYPAGCVAPNCNLDGLVWIDRPIVDNNNRIDYPRLGIAVQTIKSDGAMSTGASPTTLIGMGGKWNTANPVGNQPGILGVRFGYNSASFAQFYRRDGSLPMTADVAAGGYNINNAKAVNAQQVNLPVGNSLKIGSAALYGDGLNVAMRAAPGGSAYAQDVNGNYVALNSGTLNANGNANVTGTTSTTQLNASNANVSGSVSVGSTVGTYQMNASYSNIWGNEQVYGNHYVNGALVARNMVYLPALAWAGYGCSGNGITTDPNGKILSCQGGVWQAAGGTAQPFQSGGSSTCDYSVAVAQCPGGAKVLGGGYVLTWFNGSNFSHAPDGSYPDSGNNRWLVVGSGPNQCFQAYANCAY